MHIALYHYITTARRQWERKHGGTREREREMESGKRQSDMRKENKTEDEQRPGNIEKESKIEGGGVKTKRDR
jgi:hypothetical protein